MKDPTVPSLSTNLEQPSLSISDETKLFDINITSTQAQLLNQRNTYNQSGISYNQAGIVYEGLYNYNEDVVPMSLSFVDMYSVAPLPLANQSIGPGFFMYLTH